MSSLIYKSFGLLFGSWVVHAAMGTPPQWWEIIMLVAFLFIIEGADSIITKIKNKNHE